MSSHGLGWKGFTIQGYRGEPGEQPESVQRLHILGLWRGHAATGERPNGHGGYARFARYPGRITFVPPSIIPAFRAHNFFEVVLCLFEPAFVNGVEEELDRRPTEKLRRRVNINDVPMRQLITLLALEAGQGGMLGRLYADHLAHSIAIRLCLLGAAKEQTTRVAASALPRHLLGRVVERMHDLNSDLDLQALAAETGYSRSHFQRMFRAATGCTPHHYLLELRLKHAQELMKQGHRSLIDIAATCGFSSHGHMSRIFRQIFGVTPSNYRRNV
jgi:AraC family transcriptional regulator